jgi:hypothetical protein
MHFRTYKVAGVQIMIASDVEPPGRLSITQSVTPPLHLHIEWDGEVWGRRGVFVGDPPFSDFGY